jgi:serine/threonine-protein kinase
MKGKELFEHFTNEDNTKAQKHFETALELDPPYVSAMSHLGFAHFMDSINEWSDSPSASSNRALELAQKALELDDQDPLAHGLTGFIFVFQREHEKAITAGTRAITLDPNFTLGHAILGLILTYSGQFDEAITILKKGYRLNPNLDPVFLRYLAESYGFLERYEEALEVCEEMEEHVLNGRLGGYSWFPPLFSSFVFQELGREEESRSYMEEALKREPDLSLERYKRLTPHKNPAYLHKELDAFRRAGMQERAPGAIQEKPSIVVLPFVNISGDPEQEYFSDGMTEEIINALANVGGLKVISRTSSFYFKGKDVDLRTIGEKLSVDHVIEGSVRKAGNKLRITAQLVNVSDDTHLWSNTYNRELKDVFTVQEEISTAIVDSLKVRLLTSEKETLVRNYTENTDAYEAYIKGRYYYLSFMEGSMEKALQSYHKAIDLDPDYALAYSSIAEWYWNLPFTGQKNVSREEVYTQAKEAINTALEIDNELAEAYSNLGMIKYLYEWDWKGAEEAFETAIKLNPGLSKAHYDYAFFLAIIGDPDKAILEARTAVELDPFNGIPHHCLGSSLFFSGQFDQALEECRQAYEMMPSYLGTLPFLINIYNMKGMFTEAMEVVNKGLELFQRHPIVLRYMGSISARKGEGDKTHEVLDELLERSQKEYVTSFVIALLYADLVEDDKAMEYLERGYETHDIFYVFFIIDYHDDDRFNAFFKKVGL